MVYDKIYNEKNKFEKVESYEKQKKKNYFNIYYEHFFYRFNFLLYGFHPWFLC